MAEGDAVSSREPSALALPASHGAAWLVRLPSAPVTLPAECACCAEPAARELRLSDGRDRVLLVGYCEACAAHVARDATRRLAAALASLLLGLSLSAALPIVFPWQREDVCVLLAGVGALLPLWLGRLGRRKLAGHAALARAVSFRAPGELVCLHGSYAQKVAEQSAALAAPVPAPRFVPWLELLLAVVVVALVAPLSYSFHHPSVRVLELGPAPTELFVDGHRVARVEPSSGESPLAGLELRLPAGERSLVSVDAEGKPVASARISLQAGRRHLYAPGSADICFWLETTSYGREQKRPDRVPLQGEIRFWVLPEEVNGWFMPSPPAPEGARATGGSTTVLRQAPCEDAPDSQ
ncbi:MAG TPA: hypothetical protein VG937_11425 [Polyangiaceae bacterium]|nr:hypothetical protein [Polyangiaceae bacterium]